MRRPASHAAVAANAMFDAMKAMTRRAVSAGDRFALADIWRASPAFNAFRGHDWMQAPCKSCALTDKDFGDCRCQAFLIAGDARRCRSGVPSLATSFARRATGGGA